MAKGIVFQPQGANPLPSNSAGLYIDSNQNFIFIKDTGQVLNISQEITSLQSGSTSISRTNNTGSTIPANTPVYAPTAGNIEPADASDDNKFRVIGLTLESIPAGQSGQIAISGVISGVGGFTHGSLVYLDTTAGDITDDPSSFPGGTNIVRLGVIDGTDLILQIEQLGSS